MKIFYYFIVYILLTSSSLAKDWQINQENSKIEFSGTHIGNNFSGNFSNFDGKIYFDSENLAKSFAKIKIDLKSAKTGDKSYDKTLPETDWLDIKNNLFAIYEAIKISKIKNDEYQIEGFLNIKNIKIPHNFKATIKIDKNKANLKAESSINRLDFNIGKSSDPSGDWVSLTIPLKIEINAIAQ